jgi:hypothetical protein
VCGKVFNHFSHKYIKGFLFNCNNFGRQSIAVLFRIFRYLESWWRQILHRQRGRAWPPNLANTLGRHGGEQAYDCKQSRRAFIPPCSIGSHDSTHSSELLYLNTVQSLQLAQSLAATWKSAHCIHMLTWEKHLKVFWFTNTSTVMWRNPINLWNMKPLVQIPPPLCLPNVTIAEM